jgi:hypothetical protein
MKNNKDNEDSKDNFIWLISWAFLIFDKTFEFPCEPRLSIQLHRTGSRVKCINKY